ncbi:hypothetical protein GCM10018954_030820 [Kutzneria kofuensis]
MCNSIGIRSATATSDGNATSIRVCGATTVTRLNTVVPVATWAPSSFGLVWTHHHRVQPFRIRTPRTARAPSVAAPSMAAPARPGTAVPVKTFQWVSIHPRPEEVCPGEHAPVPAFAAPSRAPAARR